MRSAANEVRLQIRTTEAEKVYLQNAAHRSGFKTLSEFIRVSAYEKARRDAKSFSEHESYTGYQTSTDPRMLSLEESRALSEMIASPKEPTQKLNQLLSKENMDVFQAVLKEHSPFSSKKTEDALAFLFTEEGKQQFRKALEQAQRKSGL